MPAKPSSRDVGLFSGSAGVFEQWMKGTVRLWHTSKKITSKWMVEGGNYSTSQNWSPSTLPTLPFFSLPSITPISPVPFH